MNRVVKDVRNRAWRIAPDAYRATLPMTEAHHLLQVSQGAVKVEIPRLPLPRIADLERCRPRHDTVRQVEHGESCACVAARFPLLKVHNTLNSSS